MGTAPSRLTRCCQRLAGNQLHHEVARAVGLFEAVDRGDVGMIQRCQHFRFALKTGEPFGIVRERFRQNFDGYVAPELGVVRLIHFAHAARANLRDDFVRSRVLCQRRWSFLQPRCPVEDDRDGRRRRLLRGCVDQEPLAVGGHSY